MNYFDTLIRVAEDCPVTCGVVPVAKGERKTIALLEYELLSEKPYIYTQEEVLFETHVRHKGLAVDAQNREALWTAFFAKPQPCLRASPLPKQYGWGVHFDSEGKVALYGVESNAYRRFLGDAKMQLKAMRSKRT